MQPWYETRDTIYWYDQYALNGHANAFATYDPDRVAHELLHTGAGIFALYAANQYGIAYYPSRHWPQHPGLNGRDYPGELTERLRRHDKRIVLYANWLDSKHPEWQFVPSRGPAPTYDFPLASWADPAHPNGRVRDLPGGGWLLPCVASPHRTQVLNVLAEIAERYSPDAVHLDMVTFNDICVCDYCRPELEAICGTDDLRPGTLARHWDAILRRQNGAIASLMSEAAEVVRRRGAIFAPNSFAAPIEEAVRGNGEAWLESLDVAISECFEAFLAPLTDLNTTSLFARWHRAIGKPSWILRTGHPMYYAHWPISKAQWEVSAAACKANGVAVFGPCGVGARPDTTSARSLLDHARHGLEFFMQDADLADAAAPVSRVALGWSWRTRRTAPPGPDAKAWAEEFVGWGRFLIEEHVPFDVIVTDDLKEDSLSRYDLVILPGLADAGPQAFERVREYVDSGGTVVAIGPTSLADVLGVEEHDAVYGPFAIRLDDDAAPVSTRFFRVTSRGEVLEPRIEVDASASVTGADDPLPVGPGEWPALCAHGLGRGRCFYVAFEVGRYFESHGDWHIREWMLSLLGRALPERNPVVRAPRSVEVTLWRREAAGQLIIHLANRTVTWSLPSHRRQPVEIVPVRDVELELELETVDAGLQISARNGEISWEIRGAHLHVRLHELRAYAALVIEDGLAEARRHSEIGVVRAGRPTGEPALVERESSSTIDSR